MAKKLYKQSSAKSILKHGETLLGHSLQELHPEAETFNGKGGLGEAVELYHYGYTPNSVEEPDGNEVGLELKCAPCIKADGYKILQDGFAAGKEQQIEKRVLLQIQCIGRTGGCKWQGTQCHPSIDMPNRVLRQPDTVL